MRIFITNLIDLFLLSELNSNKTKVNNFPQFSQSYNTKNNIIKTMIVAPFSMFLSVTYICFDKVIILECTAIFNSNNSNSKSSQVR